MALWGVGVFLGCILDAVVGCGNEGSLPSSRSLSIRRLSSRLSFNCSLYSMRKVRFACKNRVVDHCCMRRVGKELTDSS